MKAMLFRMLLTALLAATNYSLALALDYETVSPEDAQKQEIQAERQKAKVEAEKIIGKTFWYVPNPSADMRILFHPAPPINNKLYEDQFKPTSETTLEITGVNIYLPIPGEPLLDEYYFEVKFPDGKIGYTSACAGRILCASKFESHIYKKDVFTNTQMYEYVYTEPPEVIAAREHKEKEKAKKAATESKAKWKAKGGVRIGMTKEQALASNWGRPSKVNKTINANGTQEQWVYGDGNYLYFDNGVLTAVQN